MNGPRKREGNVLASGSRHDVDLHRFDFAPHAVCWPAAADLAIHVWQEDRSLELYKTGRFNNRRRIAVDKRRTAAQDEEWRFTPSIAGVRIRRRL